MNPPSFRANTRMPNFFYLENFVNVSGPKTPTAAQKKMDEDGRVENDTMVNAIVSYLYDKSRPADVPAVAGKGDVARGAKLLAERGCFGCHVADPNAQRDLVGTYRQFGPNLSGVGSKASRDWIYHWILNPKEWNPDTKMPNLRLTNEDALDIAEYLATLKAPAGFETVALPKTDEKTLDQIALYFELSNHTLFDAKAELAKMDLHGKEVYAGKNLISHYGCFACHAIPGFEDAKPIGTELTEEGSKAVHRLDFGFIHLPHTRQDWFWQKLHTPRVFDRDRARGWEEKLRMPNFRFSDRELDQMVTTVLGFQQLNAASNVVKELSPREAAIERGRRLVKDHNCQGCHVIEGVGGSFRSVVADTSLAPPIIQGEGAKVQSDWLFAFLQAPKTGQIRPWLEVHMPTFGFTDQELNDLTRYFASLDRAEYPFLIADYSTTPQSWQAGKKVFELLKCAQCHPRSAEDFNKPGVDRASLAPEPPDGRDAPAPQLDQQLDPAARRVDAGDPDADQLPEERRRAPHFAARGAVRSAGLREGPRGVRAPLRGRRAGEAVPLESRGRHEGPARLRLVDRDQRRRGAGPAEARRAGAVRRSVRLGRAPRRTRRNALRPPRPSTRTSSSSTGAWSSRSPRWCCSCS